MSSYGISLFNWVSTKISPLLTEKEDGKDKNSLVSLGSQLKNTPAPNWRILNKIRAGVEVLTTNPKRSLCLAAGIFATLFFCGSEEVNQNSKSSTIESFTPCFPLSAVLYFSMKTYEDTNKKIKEWNDISILNIKKNHGLEKLKNKEIALVFEAKIDDNGKLSSMTLPPLEPTLPIAYKKISTVEEINTTVQQAVSQGNKITALFLYAHATADEIFLSETQTTDITIHTKNTHELFPTFNLLDPQATIVVVGCNAGGEPQMGKNNIAQKIAQYSKRKVFCSKNAVSKCTVTSVKPLSVQMGIWDDKQNGYDYSHTVSY